MANELETLTGEQVADLEGEDDAKFEEEYRQATLRGLESSVGHASAVNVRFDRIHDQLVLELRGGMILTVPRRLLQDIATADPDLVAEVELYGSGSALHWEKLDADFEVQSIVAGSFGSRSWMKKLEAGGLLDPAGIARNREVDELWKMRDAAAALGRRGGQARTLPQIRAAKENGKKGGRPPQPKRFFIGPAERRDIQAYLERGYSQASLAHAIHIHPSTLSRILKEVDRPLSEDQYKKLASVKQLIGGPATETKSR